MLPFAFQVIKFNHAQPPTNDVNFRLAVQAALDMEEIMAISYPDIYQMDPALALSRSRLLHQAGTSKFNKADLNAAKALLAKSELQGREAHLHRRQLRAQTSTPPRSCNSA